MAHDDQRCADAEHRRCDPTLQAGTLTLVVDASVAVAACLGRTGLAEIPESDLAAPPLLWSETRSALHELVWRGEVSLSDGAHAQAALENLPVDAIVDDRVGGEAWRVADELGWTKTYDAEYVALAQLLHCRLVTRDERLRRGAERLGMVVLVSELTR